MVITLTAIGQILARPGWYQGHSRTVGRAGGGGMFDLRAGVFAILDPDRGQAVIVVGVAFDHAPPGKSRGGSKGLGLGAPVEGVADG